MFIIKGGKIVTENEVLEGYSLIIKDDLIHKIVKNIEFLNLTDYEVIDADGGYITPGFIDIHSDYIETMVSPRPTSMMDFSIGLKECEKVLINSGITTMYHSLSFYKDDDFGYKEIRKTENAKELVQVINNAHDEEHLIRHRLHARFEIDNLEQLPMLEEYIRDNKVHLISFMDHTPGQGQYRNLEVYRKTLKGYTGIEDEDITAVIEKHRGKEKLTVDRMREIIELAREKNISVASHDDDTVEKLRLIKELGVNISEFPITIEVAKEAKRNGMYTIVGAPNVLLGGSHSGNLSAAEAILENGVDILCSDYYPQALLYSIFILNEEYNQDICNMIKLLTINPAKALNIDNLYGSIKAGKKADILIINKDRGNRPVLSKVIVDGQVISTISYRI